MTGFFQGYLKLCLGVGHLLIFGVWAGTGIVLYVLPAYFAARWLAEPRAAIGAFFITLTATGLLSLKWKPLNQVFEVFYAGNRLILESGNKAMAECDQPEKNVVRTASYDDGGTSNLFEPRRC